MPDDLDQLDEISRRRQRNREIAFVEYLRCCEKEYRVRHDVYRCFVEHVTQRGVIVEARAPESGKLRWPEFASSDWFNWQGMFYYRTDEGILTHAGGGTLVLLEPKLCSDTEWAEICAGTIPEKFKRWTTEDQL